MRPKYPLTDEAKEAARYLVEAWNNGEVAQLFTLIDVTPRDKRTHQIKMGLGKLSDTFDPPPLSLLLELSQFQLLSLTRHQTGTRSHQNSSVLYEGQRNVQHFDYSFQLEVLLVQELRNAVEKDFEVSDYFLTVNAVGTIIQGDATITGPYQSSAVAIGELSQSQVVETSELAEKLLETLGNSFLESNEQIVEAINDFHDSVESERQSKLGKVISQLGNSLQHGANAVVVSQALVLLAPYISQIIK